MVAVVIADHFIHIFGSMQKKGSQYLRFAHKMESFVSFHRTLTLQSDSVNEIAHLQFILIEMSNSYR